MRLFCMSARCRFPPRLPRPPWITVKPNRTLMQDDRPAQGRSSSDEPSSSITTRNGSSIEDDAMKDRRDSSERQRSKWDDLAVKMMEASATTGISLCLLALVGFSYTKYYNSEVLRSIESAFETGEPVLELAGSTIDPRHLIQPDRWIPRVEQARIDRIVRGEDRESYHLIMGEKGTGKGSMLIDAMAKIEADGVVMMEAHANPEIFRIRLGHCINFKFHEDNIGALFSIRGPRDASAILDIERAFKKLEQVAITRRAKVGKPLVLIINSAHLIRDNEAGQNLFDVLQQWAEKWAVMGVAVMVISSDKYWVYERLKQKAARMEVTYIHDLSKDRAMQALRNYRRLYFAENTPSSVLEEIYDKVGGRLTFLNRVVKSVDMLAKCDQICFEEKIIFLNHCAIHGEEMDDDVMDQQKYACAAMVLARCLHRVALGMDVIYDLRSGHILPQLPLHRARFHMTRSDFIMKLHDIGIFSIDDYATVTASSIPMQRAFSEICSEPGFDFFLEATLDRISAIESLQRTREVTAKDLWNKGKYKFTTLDTKSHTRRTTEMEVLKSSYEEDEVKHS